LSELAFPKNFLWGAATSAYQIEGAVHDDGRGKSVWDDFCTQAGKILENHNGSIACDHYHLFEKDVALMKIFGLKAYRFSIAWPRIFPDGEGQANQKGIDFYKTLCDFLLEAGITPFVTLFHWDLPLALEMKFGGWKSRETVYRFVDYAECVVRELGEYVNHFITINETFCFTILSYRDDFNAMHPPGIIEDRKTVNQIVHNVLVAHGLALEAIKNVKSCAQVGFAETGNYFMPVYDSDEHIEAARKAFRKENLQILFPRFEDGYDPAFLEAEGADAPEYTDKEMRAISAPMDFIGLNYYRSKVVRHANNEQGYEVVPVPKGMPRTHMGWEITPRGIYYLLKYATDYFGDIPKYITENGLSTEDVETEGGEVLDCDRIEFYRQHFTQLCLAIRAGVNLQGYFAWSLMDNFEWSKGYTQRFGLVRVNYTNQQRILKLSGKYYRDVIKANRVL
jgi:beta-glucosidase